MRNVGPTRKEYILIVKSTATSSNFCIKDFVFVFHIPNFEHNIHNNVVSNLCYIYEICTKIKSLFAKLKMSEISTFDFACVKGKCPF